MLTRRDLVAIAGLMPLAAQAQAAPVALPGYAPAATVTGLIRTWGHGSRDRDILGGLVRDWQAAFARRQPGVRFETTLRGDATAIGGLYTGAADLALMERPPLAIELDGYQPIFGRDPFEVQVATGSLDVTDHAFAPVLLVHRSNPLPRLTLAQLDALFGADRRRGGAALRTWGDLGLTGPWAEQAVRLYSFAITDDTAQFFQRAVMAGSQKWASPLTEFDGADAGRRIAAALAQDRFGLALCGLQFSNPQLKPLALAVQDGGPFVLPARETVRKRRYPLTRAVSIFLDRQPGQPMPPHLREYLAYVLSREGQQAVERDGRYLPLTPELARREREKLA
ncbi:PstS family phosphate ABC transporter substrate-binding protein [Roseateles sp. BYS78W]|uniref:PstS family phosphate ABC transporter substrate-binding protein n=1 Tax=Pelomonas candidula TaxID=3299025 RepID=A0ABW7HJA7_9BURK